MIDYGVLEGLMAVDVKLHQVARRLSCNEPRHGIYLQ